MLYLIAICVIILALGVIFDSDEVVLIGGMLGVFFCWIYFMFDEQKGEE